MQLIPMAIDSKRMQEIRAFPNQCFVVGSDSAIGAECVLDCLAEIDRQAKAIQTSAALIDALMAEKEVLQKIIEASGVKLEKE